MYISTKLKYAYGRFTCYCPNIYIILKQSLTNCLPNKPLYLFLPLFRVFVPPSVSSPLFFRDGKYLNAKDEKGGKVFWSRGNGWVLGGLAEVLKYLPEEDKKYRPFYEQLLQEMSEKIASLQREDGYWRTNLLNADIYPMPETSGTGLFTYAIMYCHHERINVHLYHINVHNNPNILYEQILNIFYHQSVYTDV